MDAAPFQSAVIIRRARIGDLEPLLELEKKAFPSDRLSRRQMRYHIGNPRALLLVACDSGGRPVAYGLAFMPKGRAARIYSLATAAAWRGRGLGQGLLKAAITEITKRKYQKIVLEVRQSDSSAIGLYKKNGFQIIAPLTKYYADGADGYKMALYCRD